MNELPGLPPVAADRGVSAPVPDPDESLEGELGGQQPFDDALEDGGSLHQSQAPQTRRAIKGSLDRLSGRQGDQPPSGQETAKGGPDRPRPGGGTEAGGAERPVSSSPVTGTGSRRPAEVPADKVPADRASADRAPADEDPLDNLSGAESAKAFAAETASDRIGEGAGRPSVSHPAADRPGSGKPAADRPRIGDADPKATGNVSGPMPEGGAGPANRRFPVDSTRASASDGSPPAKAAPEVRLQAASRRQAQRLPGSPDAWSQADPPRQTSLGVDQAQPGLAGEASTRASSKTKARGPDEADHPDLPPADPFGLATPARAPEPQGVAAPEAAPLSAPRAAELAGQVADRILVSAPEAETSGEVRISLKESVLDGSDVRIFREDGELRIVFLARTEAAGKFLADNGTALQQALGERLGDERVRVEVESPAGTGTGADQQDNEGRSRQRYVAPDNQPDGD